MVDMKTLAERFKAERIARGDTQEKLSEVAGVSKQAISNIERGETLSPESSTLDPICEYWGINTRWMEKGTGPKERGLAGHVVIPFLRAGRVGAGATAVNDPSFQQVGGLAFLRESLQSRGIDRSAAKSIRVTGPSMLPRLRDGDTVLYDEADTKIHNGSIYVIEHPVEGALVKRLFKELDGRIRIVSDNQDPRFAPEWVTPDTYGFKVIGRVRWIGSWED